MNVANSDSDHPSTARELRKLPSAEREDVLVEAAQRAESEYRSNPDLTDFEAFSEDDLSRDHSALLIVTRPKTKGYTTTIRTR
jgi:hypothetical protein